MIFFCLLIFVMPMIRHPLWSDFIGELTVIKYLGLICFGYALVYLSARPTFPKFFESWQARWFVLFSFLAMVSYVTMAAPRPLEESPFMSYLSFLLLFFVTLVVIDSLERLRWVLLVAIGSVAYASLHVIREWQKYGGMSAWYRPGWVTGDPNYFTISALICLPFAYHLIRVQGPRWERGFCSAAVVVTLLAIILAASRGGFLGLMVVTLLILWRARHQGALILVPVLVVVLLVAVAPSSLLERFLQPSTSDQQSVDIRIGFWSAALHMIRSHPFTGIGVGNFKSLVTDFYPDQMQGTVAGIAHNTYIEVAAEMGLPGVIAFLGVVLASLRSLNRVRQDGLIAGNDIVRHAAEAFQEGLVGYAIAAFFVSAEYQKLFWLIIFLTACLVTLSTPHAIRRSPCRIDELRRLQKARMSRR